MVKFITLVNIPWHDVLFIRIFPALSLKDLYNLRSVSVVFKACVDAYFRQMEKLNLAIYRNFNQNAFWVLINFCRNIRVVNFNRCFWLKDHTLKHFLKRNVKIEDLNLSYCNQITTTGIQPLILNCKNLRTLRMINCKWLTSGALESFVYHHENLEVVDLSKCTNLSGRSLSKVIVKYPKLIYLALDHIPSVSDGIARLITLHCHQLKNLSLDHCELSDTGVMQMLTGLKAIKTMESLKFNGHIMPKREIDYFSM